MDDFDVEECIAAMREEIEWEIEQNQLEHQRMILRNLLIQFNKMEG